MVSRPLRLGVVAYLNAAPLVYGLEGDARYVLSYDVPSRVADRLHAGELDLGLIPAIEYARGDYAIVPGVAIGSNGPVASVNLYHHKPIDAVRRVALDTSSRSSIALARVLLYTRLGREPEYVAMEPSVAGMLEAADAGLVIGDPALYFDGHVPHLDLGEEWKRQTGLPFVYAFWAGPRGATTPRDVERLREAARQGCGALSQIAATYNGRGVGKAAQNERYLRSNISYGLGQAEQRGLREFYRRAAALGLIAEVPELKFHAEVSLSSTAASAAEGET